jgi:hypothetical protein
MRAVHAHLAKRVARLEPLICVESIDLQRVRPPTGSVLVESHLRGDRFYDEIASSGDQWLTVRSEIGPYRRQSQRYLALHPKQWRGCWFQEVVSCPQITS